MTTQTSKINIGTLIHDTLNETDLLTAFATELSRVSDVGHEELRREAYREAGNPTEHAHEVINDLMDALNEYAPAHTYFGTLEGDGSDFGFWADNDFGYCETEQDDNDSELWHDTTCEVDLHVNDHGNITLFDLNGNEIWSAV